MKRMIILSLSIFSLSYGITFEETVAIAEKNVTNIKLSQMDVLKTEAQIKEATGNILPSILLTGTFTRWDPNYISGFTPKNQYSAKLGLTQKIFDYQIFSLIKLAQTNKETQEVIKEDIKQKVKDTARRLFLTALVNREIMNIKEENLKYWQENYRFVEAKYNAGLVAKYDFMRASSQLQSAIADYESAKANYQKSLEDLKRFLMVDEITQPEGSLEKLNFSFEENIENNTELRVLKEQIKLAQSQINYQKSANYPSLSAFLNYQTNNQRNFPAGNEIWKKGYNLGLSLNWQIFDGFIKDSRVLQSQIDKSKYQIQLEDKIKQIQTEISKAKLDLNSIETQIRAQEENLKTAKEALRLSTERFKAGVATTLEILDSQTNYQNTQLSYIMTLYNYNIRVLDILNITGR